jgi:NADPH:quinone reductase
MKAAVVTPQGVQRQEVPTPIPSASQVLVRVRAVGLNRADLGVAAGRAHGAVGGAGTIVGMEFAGEVVAVGAEVKHVKPGERVMGSGTAAFAEYAVADWGRVHRIPHVDMDFTEAATLPMALQTMHNAVITVGGLKPGETVLVQGASSGVGLMALQIAKLVGAAKVIGSSTNPARRAKLTRWGADLAIDTSDPAWVDQVLHATDNKGVDLIIDQVSGSVANQNLKAVRVLGRIVNVGRLGGMTGEFDFDFMRPSVFRISASRSARAAWKKYARSIASCVRTCGMLLPQADSICR